LKESEIFIYSNDETQIASIIHFLEEILGQFTLICSYVIHNFQYKGVTKCLILQRNLDLNGKFKKDFEKLCKQLKFILWLYFIIFNSSIAIFQYSIPWSLKLVWIFSLHIQGFTLTFFYILIAIEESLVLELKQFKYELEFSFLNSDIENAKLKFWKISENFKQFLKAFEPQISFLVSLYSINIAFAVNYLMTIMFLNILI
jgi:hypothetical protein